MRGMSDREKKKFGVEKITEYSKDFMNARVASMNGYVDEVIKPEATRERLYADILLLAGRKPLTEVKKKHGNIPL